MFRKYVLLTISALVFFIAVFSLSAQTSVDAGELLLKAETAFSEGNELLQTNPELSKEKYRAAVLYYNSIIESGIVNASLYYNMANSYYRLDELGQAVLNYRRALLYAPGDPQIEYNLNFAREKQKNGFTRNTEHEIFHILFFWHYMLPLMWKAVLLIAANFIFWGMLIMKRLGRPFLWMAVLSAFLGLLMAGSLYLELRESNTLYGVITSDSTIGRMGDSRSYESSYDLPLYQGVEIRIEQQRAGWILAELPNGELTWLEEKDCSVIEGRSERK